VKYYICKKCGWPVATSADEEKPQSCHCGGGFERVKGIEVIERLRGKSEQEYQQEYEKFLQLNKR